MKIYGKVAKFMSVVTVFVVQMFYIYYGDLKIMTKKHARGLINNFFNSADSADCCCGLTLVGFVLLIFCKMYFLKISRKAVRSTYY